MKKKTRKGMTVIEIVVALLLMALAIIVMGRLTATRIAETEYLNYQFTMQAADGVLYNVYKDYHACNSFTLDTIRPHDTNPAADPTLYKTILSFDLGSGGIHIYEYDKETYWLRINGAEQFKCDDFVVNGDTQHLYVSLRLPTGERLEYTIYA